MIGLMLADPKWSQEHLLLCFAISSCVVSLSVLVVVGGSNPESKVCRNNAVGFTSRDGASTCAAQSVFLNYFTLTCVASWCLVCVDMFLRTVVKIETNNSTHKIAHYAFIWIAPLFSTLYLLVGKVYGYSQTVPWCSYAYTAPRNVDLWSFYLPVFIVGLIGLFSVVAVSVRFVYIILKHKWVGPTGDETYNENTRKDILKGESLKTMILFVLLFFVIWCTIFIYRFSVYENSNEITLKFQDWVTCIFENYDGSSQESWIAPCGEIVPGRGPIS